MKSWTWLSTFLLITTFLMVIDRGETKRMTSSDLEAGEQLSNKYPFEQSPPPGCQEGQFGIVYVVYGRNSDMQRDLEIMLTYLDTFFTTVYGGKLPVYRGQQVSVSIVCSPAAAVMVERLLRAPDYRRIALQYDVRLVRAKGTGGEDFKATRIYMQRYFAPVQYALFLDLDSLPRPNFLAMFDHLLQGPYDMVDSYAKIPFGQSVKISRSFSVGYLTNQTLIEELYHFVERNGGTIAYNMHSPAVLNLLDLEYQLVSIYSRGTTIGDQLGLRLAIFISTHLWSAPFALREMSLSWEHEVCRGAVSAAVLRNCLFHHQPHPQRLDLAEQVQKWTASLLEAMSEPLPTDSLVSRLKKLDDMITHFDQQSSLQTAAEKKTGDGKSNG